MLVRHSDISGMGALLAEYLNGVDGALERPEIEAAITELADAMGRGVPSGRSESVRIGARAGVIRRGLLWAAAVRPERLAAMTRETHGPFTDPVDYTVSNATSIGEAAERALYGDGWWPVLSVFDVSDSGFDHLLSKVESGEMARRGLLGVTTTNARMEKVLAQAAESGEVLEASFPHQHCGWLARDPELLGRVLTASECEEEGLFGIGHDVEGWNWGWVRDEWLRGLGPQGRADIAFQINRVSESTSAPWHCDRAAMRKVLTSVRGAAAAVGTTRGAASFAREVLDEVLDELFGEDRDVARGLLNPAATLTELADVVARLG